MNEERSLPPATWQPALETWMCNIMKSKDTIGNAWQDMGPQRLYVYVCVCVCVCVYIYIYIYIHTHTHTHTHIYIYIYMYIWIRVHTHIYLSINLSTYLPTYLPIYLSIYLPIYLPTYLPIYLSIYLYITYIHITVYISTRIPIWSSTGMTTGKEGNLSGPQRNSYNVLIKSVSWGLKFKIHIHASFKLCMRQPITTKANTSVAYIRSCSDYHYNKMSSQM